MTAEILTFRLPMPANAANATRSALIHRFMFLLQASESSAVPCGRPGGRIGGRWAAGGGQECSLLCLFVAAPILPQPATSPLLCRLCLFVAAPARRPPAYSPRKMLVIHAVQGRVHLVDQRLDIAFLVVERDQHRQGAALL
jgi:hypothetical protein